MAESQEDNLALQEQLQKCVDAVNKVDNGVEPQTAAEVQKSIAKTIEILENLTRQISQLSIFSPNEDLDEVSTSYLRFLLLPALLGYLTEKISNRRRKESLETAEVYFKDFLVRLMSYNVISRNFYSINEDVDQNGDETAAQKIVKFKNPSAIREEKIRRFREQQELKITYESLKNECGSDKTDDAALRKFYITELQMWANRAEEMLRSIEMEKPLVERMELVKSEETPEEDVSKKQKQVPLKPIIITRNALQKKIFGLGYPSVPTLSLEDFFEQKRQEGQIQVLDHTHPGNSQRPMTEEEEKIAKEEAAERENEELIRAEREYDEYRDEHRRGWGSVHNKG